MPIAAFDAPGPRVTSAMPGRPVILPHASAMYAAPPSCRQTIVASRSRTSCSASSTARKLSPGTQNTCVAPCAIRLATRIWPPVRSEVIKIRLLSGGPDELFALEQEHAAVRRRRLEPHEWEPRERHFGGVPVLTDFDD